MTTPFLGRLRRALFTLVGTLLLVAAVYSCAERLVFLQSARFADGRVSALNAGGSHPQIDFADHLGRPVSYPQNGLIFGYREGMPVRVRYLEAAPAGSAVLDDIGAIWGTTLLLGVLGAAFALAGLAPAAGARIRSAADSRPAPRR